MRISFPVFLAQREDYCAQRRIIPTTPLIIKGNLNFAHLFERQTSFGDRIGFRPINAFHALIQSNNFSFIHETLIHI